MTELLPYDAAAVLVGDKAEQAALLEEALASGDPGIVARALSLIAAARGAPPADVALAEGHATLERTLAVARDAGFRLSVVSA